MDTSIQSREESYLAKIAGENVEVPENPESRSEYWLKKIAENGTGGTGGGSVTVDSEMSDTSTNPAQNKVVKKYVDTSVLPETERAKIHTHANKDVLDAIEVPLTNQYMSQFMQAVANSHAHNNKSILDAIQVPLTGEMNSKWNTAADNVTSVQNRVNVLESITSTAFVQTTNSNIENAMEAPFMQISVYGATIPEMTTGEVPVVKEPTMDDPADFTGRRDANGSNPITITKNVDGISSSISRGVLLYTTLYGVPIPASVASSHPDMVTYVYDGTSYIADEAIVTTSSYSVMQRIQYAKFTTKNGWMLENRTGYTGDGKFRYTMYKGNAMASQGVCVSTLPQITLSQYKEGTAYGLFYDSGYICLRVEGITTLDELVTWFGTHLVKVAFPLAVPISHPSTSILDSRDAGYIRELLDFGLSGNYTKNNVQSYYKDAESVFGVKYATPPVSKWAAQPTKPTYTAEEVNAVSALRPKSTYGYIRKDLISIVDGEWSSSEYTFTHDGYVTFDPNHYYDGELYHGNQYTARRDEIRIDGVPIGIIGYSRVSVTADDSLYVMTSMCTIPNVMYVHAGQTISAVQSTAAAVEEMAGAGLTMYIWDTEPGGSQGRTS